MNTSLQGRKHDTDNYNRHSLDNVRSDTVEHKGVRHEIK